MSAKEISGFLCRSELIRLLNENGLAPNKALGQNFLTDESAVCDIIDASKIDGRPVLEIGPGLGSLTGCLLERASSVAAVEIDRRMSEILGRRFGGRLKLYNEDFLKSDLDLIRSALGGGSFCAVGNLPYYVTTPICMRLLEYSAHIESMTLMVQEEAAERFFALPGSRVYGPMAVLTQAYYDAKNVLRLSPSSYYPQPDVYSRVVRLSRSAQPVIDGLTALLKCAFHMRRKTLVNNLKTVYSEADIITEALSACSLPINVRAEALSAEDYIRLSQALLH